MNLLYLRKELGGVGYYKDAEYTQRLCLNPWPSAPDYRFKYATYNCAQYKVEWIK
jgi:hypothetical protein